MNRWRSLAVLFAAMFLMAGSAFGYTVNSGFVVIDTEGIQPSTSGPAPTSAFVQLLINGGFETGALAPWTQSGTSSVVNTTPHSGTFCSLTIGNNWIRQDFAPINTASVLSVSFWCKQPEPNTQAQAYDLYYSDTTFDEGLSFPADDWTLINITSFMRPAGALLTGIRLWGYSGGGPGPDETFIDDVVIDVAGATAVEPATWGEIKNTFR